MDELLSVHGGRFGGNRGGLDGGILFHVHGLGCLLHPGALLLGRLLSILFRGLPGRFFIGLGGLLRRGLLGRLFRRFGGIGLRLAAAGGFLRGGGIGGCSLGRGGRGFLHGFGLGFLLGLLFLLLGGASALGAGFLFDGFLGLDPGFLVQDGKAQFLHAQFLRILDAQLLSECSELLFAHRVQFQ